MATGQLLLLLGQLDEAVIIQLGPLSIKARGINFSRKRNKTNVMFKTRYSKMVTLQTLSVRLRQLNQRKRIHS